VGEPEHNPLEFLGPADDRVDVRGDEFMAIIEQDLQPKPPKPQKAKAKACDVRLVTTPELAVPGWHVTQTLPMISAHRIVGLNAWKDFLVAVRDLIGGRSQTAEAALSRMEHELLAELQAKAQRIGAHAVVAVRVQIGEISGGGKGQMLYASAHGTPVVLSPVTS
jgi:uncharacterized protein YbjQ (UPF0145 family)